MTTLLDAAAQESFGKSTLYDHIAPTLSRLDMEIIRSIPEGGNWQDIPLEVASKSVRIMRIRASGGRTTYYGRLRRDAPSPTVNTFFHRPGNGSFVHPVQDRMISLREAARLQSFPDSFRFVGPRSSVYRQIGNAVPPLLAYALGRCVHKSRVVDMFCGAGGLSQGLKMAGHSVVAAFDRERHMCSTFRLNHPDALVREVAVSSLCLPSIVEDIESVLRGRTLGLLAGGPPCQGFSTAGRMDKTDPRNSLVFSMTDLVRELQPEAVLIENVLGLRSFRGGDTIADLTGRLNELGYETETMVLKAEQYGVPQRRRRVFLVASRDGERPEAPRTILPEYARTRRSGSRSASHAESAPITVEAAIGDLPAIPSGGGDQVMTYRPEWTRTDYQRYSRGTLDSGSFLDRLSRVNT
ncbi:MAG: DNA cytosine methyltransferase [Candidatus Thorarchaeota archaeon]|nr:DNA cytosine methyltransferase [Candidatus Thorarchaeota archaeon]